MCNKCCKQSLIHVFSVVRLIVIYFPFSLEKPSFEHIVLFPVLLNVVLVSAKQNNNTVLVIRALNDYFIMPDLLK